jgi:hypothetical protein
MLRLILGAVLGLFVGVLVTAVVEGTGHAIFPPPPGVDLTDPATLKSVMSQVPLEAKIAVLLAWFLGVLFGASTADLVAGRRALAGRIVSLVIFGFAAWTMISIPHPAWFVAAACVAMLLGAFLADRAFGRPRTI